jgi:hypothetical protein
MYQRSIVWAMTASAAFVLLSLRLSEDRNAPVQVLYGELAASTAWVIAFVFFFLLGGFALSAIRRARTILDRLETLKPCPKLREDILLYPSLATIHTAFYRVGSVLVCPFAFSVAFAIETTRGWRGEQWQDLPWGGLIVLLGLVLFIYGSIVTYVWRPLGVAKPNRQSAP